ncbi:MAG: DUF6798 domain-containing protein [Planctomycetota bacterium]|jgi:hypothetical protein
MGDTVRTTSADSGAPRGPAPGRWLVAVEIVLVFGVFFAQGAWPVPDVNEPYYLGKAIHFWDRDWASGDAFLDSADAHQVFCFTFGWLSLWLTPWWLAWFGRVLTWGLLAWAWRRLSFALVPRRGFAVLTAALWVGLLERYHLAGEWVIGGVEAKGFAYVLVLLGLEALVRNRWNAAWLLFGGASAFHVLVGGWSVVAAGVAWLLLGRSRPTLRSMWPAILGGLVLSLPGLVPSLALSWGVDATTANEAHDIYVYRRLAHHLVPSRFPPVYLDRFLLLILLYAALECIGPTDGPRHRLRWFVVGALAIAAAGVAAGLIEHVTKPLAARLLRFYWFRLADVAVPLAVAISGARCVAYALGARPRLGRWAAAAAVVLAAYHVGGHAIQRVRPTIPRADRLHEYSAEAERLRDYLSWRNICRWVAESESIPQNARFLTPRVSQTFKWYAGRAEVVTWKDVPQDARSIVRWWDRLNDVHAGGRLRRGSRWHDSLAELGELRLDELARRYDADYVLTLRTHPLKLPVECVCGYYVIYRLRDPKPQ